MKNTLLGLSTIILSFTTLNTSAQSGVTQQDLDGKLGLNTITTSLPFLGITVDSRAGAMGEAGTALRGSYSSLYWNTSALIFAPNKSEIGISYTPWLRNLTNDMHMSDLSGYYKFGRHAVGGALRFFSLGNITYTGQNGDFIRDDKPSEFAITAGYAFKMSDRWSVGLNGKFAYSNLTGGYVIEGVESKAAIAGAADLSFTYLNEDVKIKDLNADYTFAFTLNNIGNKVSYSTSAQRDFIPMNLKIANALNMRFDKYNSLMVAFELQKLLVPSPAIYGKNAAGETVMISGHSNDVGVIKGLIQSFYDAPGTPIKNEQGKYVQNEDGSYAIKKGSKAVEELSEINVALGLEYWYNKLLAIRAGYFYEAPNKGNRQFFTVGAGLRYNRFGIDISYLAATGGRRSPLANTLRFSLIFTLDKRVGKAADEDKPE